MKAIHFATPGDPDVLTLVDRPEPNPRPGEVLIAVRAAGVNRADVMQRRGLYPPPPGAPDILGLEVAGEILAIVPSGSSGATAPAGLAVGQPVMALLAEIGRAHV